MVGFCDCCNEPVGSVMCTNFFTIWGTISFSRRALFDGVSYNSWFYNMCYTEIISE